jgi:hypothetical protein
MMNDLMFVVALGTLTIKLLVICLGAMAILAAALLAVRFMAEAEEGPPGVERF